MTHADTVQAAAWTWNPTDATEVLTPPARWLDHAPTVTAMTPVSAATVELPAVRPAPRRRMRRWHWLWIVPAGIVAPLAGMFVAALIQAAGAL